MGKRVLLCGLALLALLAPQGLAAAVADPRAPSAPGAKPRPPSANFGTWCGTTAEGGSISFTVNRKGRITLIEFEYEIEGDDCTARVNDRAKGSIAIKNKAFKVPIQTKQETASLTGRFASRTAASGKLTATYTSDEGCHGTVSTTWRAKKGKKPPVNRVYDGTWQGAVSFPPGVDPVFLALLDPTITFGVVNGAVTFMRVPWVILGSGCQVALVDRLEQDFDPPVRLDGARLSVSGRGQKSFTVEGAFASPTLASGALTMSGTSTMIGGGSCTGSLEATWDAAKQ